jgi:hypothetical protein
MKQERLSLDHSFQFLDQMTNKMKMMQELEEM